MSEPEQKKSEVRYLRIDAARHGQRIDNFLVTLLKGVPKSYVYRIIRRGEVRVNKGRKAASYRIQEGDLVRIPPLRTSEKPIARPDDRLLGRLQRSILFEDDRFLVLNKPSGIAVHGGSGLRYGVIEAMRQLRPGDRAMELVHRLDRDTSGCLLISRRRSALRVLHELIRQNRMEKRYLALLSGAWRDDRVAVDAPLHKNRLKSGERMVLVDRRRGKPAITRFTVRRRFSGGMLVEAELVTGRTHQIRVHAAHLGTPILGDEKYGNSAYNRELREKGLKRMFLHAESIGFDWPEPPQRLVFHAPLEPALEKVIKSLDSERGAGKNGLSEL